MKPVTISLTLLILLSGCVTAHSETTYVVESNEALQSEQVTEAQRQQLLAPIALYPDTILSHILIASTYPLDVIRAYRWRQDKAHLDNEELIALAEELPWDPSVKALLAFPDILERMHDDLDWTQQIGAAFLQDESATMASIQDLRKQADRYGSLNSMHKVEVVYDKDIIIIEPRDTRIVYVPIYDPLHVYGHWRWRHYQPTSWYSHHNFGLFNWHHGTHFVFGIGFSNFHWHNRHVYIDHGYWHKERHYKRKHFRRHHQIVHTENVKRWHHNPRKVTRMVSKQHYIDKKAIKRQHKNQHKVVRDSYAQQKINKLRQTEQPHLVKPKQFVAPKAPNKEIHRYKEVKGALMHKEHQRKHTSVQPKLVKPKQFNSPRINKREIHRNKEVRSFQQQKQHKVNNKRSVNSFAKVKTSPVRKSHVVKTERPKYNSAGSTRNNRSLVMKNERKKERR